MKRFALLVVVLVLSGIIAKAWLRAAYDDATVVNRSELIVVGRLKAKSLGYVQNGDNPAESSAILVISAVIKGKSELKEIPIIIHYGLTPIAGNGKNYPTNTVPILDTGNSVRGGPPVIEDATVDNIWFLRRLGGNLGRELSPTNDLGVLDPQDLEPLQLKEYFQSYLSADPKTAVKTYVEGHPEVAWRTQKWLDRP